jgi:D-xylose transport system permease protein
MAELIGSKGWPWWVAVIGGIVVGVLMGLLIGWLVSFVGIPSFVVTLAFFLAWQGVLLWIIGDGGTVIISQPVIVAIENGNMPIVLGWIVVVASIALYAATSLLVWRRRVAKNMLATPLPVVVIRIAVIAVLLLFFTWAMGLNRSKGTIVLHGIPWIAPLVGVLLVIWTFVQNRTAFGRYVYAVGGNAEAARRAGIRVSRITIYCFVISSSMGSCPASSMPPVAGRSIPAPAAATCCCMRWPLRSSAELRSSVVKARQGMRSSVGWSSR